MSARGFIPTGPGNVRTEEEVSLKVLTDAEFQQLLGALDVSDIWSVRNYWMLVLFVHTGLGFRNGRSVGG